MVFFGCFFYSGFCWWQMQRILLLSLVEIVTIGELILYILFQGIKQTVYFLRIKKKI